MEFVEYPKFRYFADKEPVIVNDRAEEDALEGEHFDLPGLTNHPEDYSAEDGFSAISAKPGHVHHEYPKMMKDQETVVNNEEEEAAWRALNDDPGEPENEEEPEEEKQPEPKKTKGAAKTDDKDDLL